MPTVKIFLPICDDEVSGLLCQGDELVGTHWEFSEPEAIITLTRAAECQEHDIRQAEKTLREYRPGSVDLSLTP
jgi:hypothetical protein